MNKRITYLFSYLRKALEEIIGLLSSMLNRKKQNNDFFNRFFYINHTIINNYALHFQM